jgi:hypothetical protein
VSAQGISSASDLPLSRHARWLRAAIRRCTLDPRSRGVAARLGMFTCIALCAVARLVAEAVISGQTFHLAPEIILRAAKAPKSPRFDDGQRHRTEVPCDLPEAENAVPQEQQDASPTTASMLIRASAQGSAEAQGYISSPIRAAGRICADGQGQVPGHSYNCAVGATGRMTWAEVGFGTGARTERACSPSVWRARGRRQRGRPCAAGAVARAPSD